MSAETIIVTATTIAVRALIDSLSAWVSGLDVAHLAGVGDELLPALLTAGMRFVVDWGAFADALRALGVEVPSLPAGMLADVGAE